jgi:hypothetical protein
MCQMAFDEGYRVNNLVRTITLHGPQAKPILVANHKQWRRFEEALVYPPARLYARLNVTSWARRREMIGFRPSDFDFEQRCLAFRSRYCRYHNGTVARFCDCYPDSGMAGRIGSLFAAFDIRWLYSYPSWMACSTVIPGTRT